MHFDEIHQHLRKIAFLANIKSGSNKKKEELCIAIGNSLSGMKNLGISKIWS